MKKNFFLVLVFLSCLLNNAFAQNPAAKKADAKTPAPVHLSHNDSVNQQKLNGLMQQVALEQKNIQRMADSLHLKVTNPATSKEADAKVETISQTLASQKTTLSIGIILLAFMVLMVYFILNTRLARTTQVLDSQITLAKHEMERYTYEVEKQTLGIDAKLVALMYSQLALIKEERDARENISFGGDVITDHKLPIKVGEEVHRMKKRIENMDQDVKGLGALVNSLKRLEEQLVENGYEMEELMGKKYVDGMKLEARFVDNPDIPPGEERITDVLRPEIKYKGEVIQVAKVEVGKSY